MIDIRLLFIKKRRIFVTEFVHSGTGLVEH